MLDNFISGDTMDYEGFLRDNRYKVNRALNKVLWICIITGPAIALGILGGVFKRTTYLACIIISCVMAAVAGGDALVLRKKPHSYVPGFVALVAVNLLLGYMNISHISIRLTWVLVPLLSLLFCDRRVFIGTSALNYVIMGLATWFESTHYADVRTDFSTPLAGFINIFAGCTIEALVMFFAGLAICRSTNSHYRKMIDQYAETQDQKKALQEQLDVLDSMAEIYDYVNLIDFNESTEMSLRQEKLQKLSIEPGQDHTHMTQGLRSQIAADMADDFWRFTDITTVPARMVNRKSISGEFISNDTGWFRAQYIRVEGKLDRKPDVVIYTIQNIDADKRREEHLIRISRTDELTRMYNRHCYEEDIAEIRKNGAGSDLALISADVNGLKKANDEKGHAAGDELIRGAAACLFSAVGAYGKVYRTGGDEFVALVNTPDCGTLIETIREKTSRWHGMLMDSLTLSVGFAAVSDNPGADIGELERLADTAMYEDKARFYRQAGQDRRRD